MLLLLLLVRVLGVFGDGWNAPGKMDFVGRFSGFLEKF